MHSSWDFRAENPTSLLQKLLFSNQSLAAILLAWAQYLAQLNRLRFGNSVPPVRQKYEALIAAAEKLLGQAMLDQAVHLTTPGQKQPTMSAMAQQACNLQSHSPIHVCNASVPSGQG